MLWQEADAEAPSPKHNQLTIPPALTYVYTHAYHAAAFGKFYLSHVCIIITKDTAYQSPADITLRRDSLRSTACKRTSALMPKNK